jgi:hypothetical protein
LLSFTYVYFFESGLFNGLRLIQIKKSFPVSGFVRLARARTVLPYLFAARPTTKPSFDLASKENSSTGFCFSK